MKKLLIWFTLNCKRQLLKPLFIFLLFLCPILCAAAGYLGSENSSTASVALYFEESDEPFSEEIKQTLSEHEGIINFYLSESEDSLYNDVAAEKAECGYIIPSDIKQYLDSRDMSGQITCVGSPASVVQKLIDEVVFSSIFKIYAKDITLSFLDKEEYLTQVSENDISDLYDYKLADGSTFSFKYNLDPAAITSAAAENSPVRGIIALFILICGFMGVINTYRDEHNQVYTCLPGSLRYAGRVITVAVPVCLSSIMAFACLIWTDGNLSWGSEIIRLAAYAIITSVYCCLLKFICKKEAWFWSLIPMLTLLCIIATPIYIDFGSYLPVINWIGRLLPTSYY